MEYPGGTITDRMVEYVTGPLGGMLGPGDLVVADNLAAHQANRVSEALAEQDAEIGLLPPYAPDLNPIERLWSKIKATLRSAKAWTVDRLQQTLTEALEGISNSDLRNWFARSDHLQLA